MLKKMRLEKKELMRLLKKRLKNYGRIVLIFFGICNFDKGICNLRFCRLILRFNESDTIFLFLLRF